MNRLMLIIALLASLLLTGCGAIMDMAGKSPVYSRTGRRGTNTTASIPDQRGAPPAELGAYGEKTNPYTVMGKRYYPLKTANGYDEVGIASWYGSENHGMQTASGSTYNMYSMSAAHKTLPLGTIVRVTNLENQRTVDLLINDRGPFVGSRIIDLSYGAAQRIGFAGKGLAKVRVKAIGTHSSMVAQKAKGRVPTRTAKSRVPTETASASTPNTASKAIPNGYFIQVGAFSVQANATEVRDNLRARGITGARIDVRSRGSKRLYIVQAGPFSSKSTATRALASLKTLYPSSFIAAL